MRASWLSFSCVLVALAAIPRPLAAQDIAPTTNDLLARALQLEDLRVAGLPPLDFRAQLEVTVADGKTASGDYSLQWVSPSQAKEEISFANFQRVRLLTANGYWQNRNLEYQPEVIFQIDTLLELKSVLKLGFGETLGKVREKKQGAVRLSCVEKKQAGTRKQELCFDPSNGTLLSVEFPTSSHQHAPEITRIEYSDFKPWEGKLLPHEIQAWGSGKSVARIRVLHVRNLDNVSSTSFEPPKNAEFWTSCTDTISPAKLENPVQPHYPPRARTKRVQGRVTFYGVVESDGTLSHLTIIHPADPDLEAAAGQAVRQWRYKPVACTGAPMRTETFISVDFWLDQ